MEAHQLVPDVLDFAPPHVATVKFPSGVSMSLGNELTPLQVKDAPSEVDFPSEPGALYTVLFTYVLILLCKLATSVNYGIFIKTVEILMHLREQCQYTGKFVTGWSSTSHQQLKSVRVKP